MATPDESSSNDRARTSALERLKERLRAEAEENARLKAANERLRRDQALAIEQINYLKQRQRA